jgi:hypothetical protein
MATIVFFQIMDLGMTVMARSYGIVSSGIHDLLRFQLAISTTCVGKSRLQKTAAAAATIVVGFVGSHVDEIFLSDNLFHNIAEIIGHGVAVGLSNKLTRVLDGEGYLEILVPV